VSPPPPEQSIWVIEPLLDAGLDLDEIRVLVFRLAFQTIVDVPTATLLDLAGDRPTEVQAAWLHTIGRMISGDGGDGGQ
jgi:hypothetical protein